MNQPTPPSHGKVYYIKDGNRIKWFTREEYLTRFLNRDKGVSRVTGVTPGTAVKTARSAL